MSKDYESIILTKLIRKYERSKVSKTGSNLNLKISIKLDAKNFDEYINEDSYKYEDVINKSIMELKKKNFIDYTFKNNRIDKVILNLEMIQQIYQALNMNSPKNETDKYLALIANYKGKGNLTNLFAEKVEVIINNYKPHLKYFKNYQELKELFVILDGLDNQKEEISMRRFSSKYLKDSKRLETILPRLEKIIKELEHYDGEHVIHNYNVYKNPTFVYIKGSIILKINEQVINLDKLASELIISSNQINQLEIIKLNTKTVITVENLTTFYDYKIDNNLIIYLGGFHNEIRRNLLLKIYHYNKEIKFYHSGDIDAGGFYILNHLIEKTNINFLAKDMDKTTLIKYKDNTKQLTVEDRKRLNNLKNKDNIRKYLDVIDYMLEKNVKLEQENIEYD